MTQQCDGSNALQRWRLGADRQIVNDATGLCLDANGGGTGNGTALLIWGCGGQANQKWWYSAAYTPCQVGLFAQACR